MREKEKMAYIAGIIDGDGSISLFKRQEVGAKNPQYTPCIQLSKSSQVLPSLLKEEFGGAITYVKREGRNKPEYRWRLYGAQKCLPFLDSVSDYLCNKKKQALELISFIEKNPYKKGQRLTDDVLIDREKSYLKMKSLNFNRDKKPQLMKNSKVYCHDYFWQYFAGLLDTDGSFSIRKETKKVKRWTPIILLSLVNSYGMSFIRNKCKYGNFFLVKAPKLKQKFYYRFGAYSKSDVMNILTNVIPYLRNKKKQALVLLRFCEGFIAQGGRYLKTDEQSFFRESCYQELCNLNKYGVSKSPLIDFKPLPGRAGGKKAEAAKAGTVNAVSEETSDKEDAVL